MTFLLNLTGCATKNFSAEFDEDGDEPTSYRIQATEGSIKVVEQDLKNAVKPFKPIPEVKK